MKVYLDLILFLNFMFDLILISATGMILRRKMVIKNVVLGSLLGSLSTFMLFFPINSLVLILVKIVISMIMVLVSFGYRDYKYTCKNLFYLYTSSLILGGGMYLLNNEFSYKQEGLVFYHNGLSINFVVLIILSPLIIYLYVNQLKELKNNYSKYYNVDIYFKDGTKKEVTAFLDTGNKLNDPYKKRPIILINKNIVNIDYSNNLLLVPFDTVNSHGLLKCIIPDKIDVLGVGVYKDVLIGISEQAIKIDGVDCILHEKTLEGFVC